MGRSPRKMCAVFVLVALAVLVAEPVSAMASDRAVPDSQPSAAPADRHIAVILLNFTNDTSQPWSTDVVSGTIFGAGPSVATYYGDVSYGMTTITGDVYDWVTVPFDNSSCAYGAWGSAALSAAHVDTSQYDNVLYVFPRTTCTWAGLSTIGGKFSWINGFMTVHTIGHELGHDMGVHHASTLNCTSNGVRVALSATCTRVEYGDTFSIMGTGTREMTNLERAQIGWLGDVRTITASGTVLVTPTELGAQQPLFRVARGDGTYLYFEYRQPVGIYDDFTPTAPIVNGLSIRLAPDVPSHVQSALIDTRPSTATFDDAPLTVSRTFTDPATGITITTTSVSAAGATVSVQWPGAPAPTPSSTPTPSPTPTPTPSPTPTPTAPPSPTPTPTPTPTAPATPTPTPTPTSTQDPPAPQRLTAPTTVTAVRTSARRVGVNWTSASGPVAGYRVVRNGIVLGKVTDLQFVDRVPRNVQRVTYAIRAYDRYGHLGPRRTYTLLM